MPVLGPHSYSPLLQNAPFLLVAYAARFRTVEDPEIILAFYCKLTGCAWRQRGKSLSLWATPVASLVRNSLKNREHRHGKPEEHDDDHRHHEYAGVRSAASCTVSTWRHGLHRLGQGVAVKLQWDDGEQIPGNVRPLGEGDAAKRCRA